MKKFRVGSAAGVAAVLSVMWVSPAAIADEESTVDVVANVTPADVTAAIDTPLLDGGESTVTIDRLTVDVSTEATDGVSISAGSGTATIGLPFADDATAGISTDPGTVTYDNGNASSSVVLVHDTGSVQVATVIDTAAAPTRYDYPIDLPEASSLVLQGGGGVAVVDDATGEVLGSFAAPWAKDATGKDVRTRYEVEGQTLTQVVEHNTNYVYPVVADPTYTTSVIYLSKAQVVTMYNGLHGISGACSALPIPYPASIACLGLAPAAQVEKAYWNKWRIKVTYYNCGFNYCSYTTYTAVP
ncbi:hypothetical protein [Microbacterium sufflavum]|uniref:Uncharacterized protein n=1 Tax=Microbacterium sufflavum TaxID=2851649 RepID=A0ABY4ID43_9MICO|nr:hypothetical protein [Microbacterium sufflavum]UPL10477.1 hypothetical protein KV394_04880 [Microbacterium sufflavum]